MEISLKKITEKHEFEVVKKLYISAFPFEERREYNELIQQLYIDGCAVNLVIAGGETAGFCIVWDFTDFVYLEHFAIEPALRGLGIGEGILALINNSNKPVILETEPPSDEISNRRIRFYQRNGFRLLHRPYVQPSYDGIKPAVEMKLMSTRVDLTTEELDKCITTIRTKVYRIR